MSTQIKLPNLGENIESGDVLTILVSEGDTIDVEQDLLEIETDKATMPVPSPQAGRIVKILVSEGETIQVGAPILEIDSDSAERPAGGAEPSGEAASDGPVAAEQQADQPEPEEAPPQPEAQPPKPQPKRQPAAAQQTSPDEQAARKAPEEPTRQTSAPARPGQVAAAASLPMVGDETPGDGHSSTAASPAVRRLARQLGVDLRHVQPSGEAGRITSEDVTAHVREANQRAARGETTEAAPGMPETDDWGTIRRERMSRLRQTIARNMFASYSTIPQLTNFDDADITELEQLRQESKADYAARNIKLTTMPFVIKAVASSLKQNPILNATIDEESNEIIFKEYINLGIAVDTDRGLIVPVLREADQLSIPEIATALAAVAKMAREGTFKVEDLRGGTFTISNLGAVGGTYSTPIINPPEVAILLAGRSRIQPAYVDNRLAPRLMLPLSITYDHRVVDGAAAARFLNEVKSYLSAPGRLLLAP